MDLPLSDENDDALLDLVRAEEPELTSQLEQIIDCEEYQPWQIQTASRNSSP
jgi:hypothetical protein